MKWPLIAFHLSGKAWGSSGELSALDREITVAEAGGDGMAMLRADRSMRVTSDMVRDVTSPNGSSIPDSEGLRIQLLGEFQVRVGPRTVDESEWYLRKAKNLVKLLALAPGHRMHRGQLIDLLWPNLEPDAGTNNLHKALHIARRALEPDLPAKMPSSYLHMHGDFVSLGQPGQVWIDLEAFRTAAHAAQLAGDPRAYEEALRLCPGELLPEDRYDDWAIRHREQAALTRVTLLLELAYLCEQRGESDQAIDVLQQIVEHDPAHEEAQAGLMRLFANSGCRQLALRQYQQLRDALREELDAEPDPSIQRLYQRLLRGDFPSEGRRGAGAETHPATAISGKDRSRAASLVGRDSELGHLSTLVDRLFGGQGNLAIVSGDTGVGKSRLVTEVADQASSRGAVTLYGAAFKGNKEVPYAPFGGALAGFSARIAPNTLSALMGDAAVELAKLAPTVASVLNREEEQRQRVDEEDRPQITAAMSSFFTRLSQHAPLVVVLDNLHVADDASLLLLRDLAPIVRNIPTLLLCTTCSEEVSLDNTVGHLLEVLEHERLVERIHLRPLGHEDMHQLATRLLGAPADQSVLDTIYSLAQGNPYYTEEAVRALQGRGRIYKANGVWSVRQGITIRWGQADLRRRDSASGDWQLQPLLRALRAL